MRGKKKKREKPQVISYLVILFLTALFLYPVWHTFVVSLSDSVFANQPGFKFWPPRVTFDAYQKVFSTDTVFTGYYNTLIRTGAGTIITLVITYFAAFALSHKELPGARFFNVLIIFTMFFSGGLIPQYLNIKSLGLLNTRWALILPGAAGAWNFIIMRNFVAGISKEMEEAAKIDGASVWQVMIRIMLPLSKPVLAVIGLWSVVGHWNAWFDALLYANKAKLVVLQTVVRRLIDQGNEMAASGLQVTMADATPVSVRAATVIVATLPVLMAYPFAQKYLVKGTMVGAVKG